MKIRPDFTNRRTTVRQSATIVFALVFVIPALLFCFLLTKHNIIGDRDVALVFGVILVVALAGFILTSRIVRGISALSQSLEEGKPDRIEQLKAKLKTREVDEIADFFNGVLGHLEEITGSLDRRVLQLSALNEMTILASKIIYLDELLEAVLSKAMDTVKANIGSILLVDENDENLRVITQRGLGPEVSRGSEQRVNESIVREVLQSGEPMLVTDIEHDPRCKNKKPDPKYGMPSFLSVPLKVKNRTIGVLNLAKKQDGTVFSQDDLDFVRTLFGQIGFAIENARLYDEARKLGLDLQEKIQKLESAQEHLIRSERLSATGKLIAGVAHELNNPLTGVIGFSELMQSTDSPERVREYAEKINSQAVRCQKIVQNLLSFARQHKPEMGLVDINETIEDALSLREYELSVDNVQIVRRLDGNLPKTMADYHRLQQVFVNIINNAYQAIHTVGDGTLTVESGLNNGSIQIKFTDTGPGISEEDLPRIFEPFFTTKETGEGTGLGLSLCYGIIKQHEGTITAANEPGAGTAFTIELPLKTEEPPPPSQDGPVPETK